MYPRKNILINCALLIVLYICVTIYLLKLPLYAEVTSFTRRMMSRTSKCRTFGYGSIMVDVKRLRSGGYQEDVVLARRTAKGDLSEIKHFDRPKKTCFNLTHNWNIKTDKPSENINFEKLKTSSRVLEVREKTQRELCENGHCNSYITIDALPGRSGNQMFQTASMLGTAYRHDLIPIIPPAFPLNEWFNMPNVRDLKLTDAELFTVKPSGKFYPDISWISEQRNWTMKGYFQSWKYFEGAEHIIKQAFRLNDKYLDNPWSFMRNVSRKDVQNVCVHMRRGDLLDDVAIRKGYVIAGLDYIYRAMDYFRTKFKTVQFIILSDGMIWCKENIKGSDVIFSPFLWPAEDMALMMSCDHVIITSGTFGWWGGWLSGGTVVYFNGYPRENSWLASQISKTDYYPPEWIAL